MQNLKSLILFIINVIDQRKNVRLHRLALDNGRGAGCLHISVMTLVACDGMRDAGHLPGSGKFPTARALNCRWRIFSEINIRN